MVPCLYCGKREAIKLTELPGNFGTVEAFCSGRCATLASLHSVLVGDFIWCDEHKAWHDQAAQQRCAFVTVV